MSEFGVLPTGFNRKRLDLLLAELNSEVKSIFGDNFNVSPESPDGQINGTLSESNANLWEIAEEAYNAFDPSAATGVTLSNLVQLNYLTRLPATFSRVQLTLSGTAGTVIPSGSVISTSDTGSQFETEADIVLDVGGTGTVFANAIISGPTMALSGTVSQIDTPITGWDTSTNSADAQVGTNEETDVELRVRRENSVASKSQAIVDAIYSAVASIPGVTQTTVLENATDVVDANGQQAHSFHVIAVGGIDQSIADEIWLKKPAGITSVGTTVVSVSDSQGIPHNISFSRPTSINIFVEVTLTTDSEYPANGDNLVKEAIVDYANGDLISGTGFFLSDDVIYTRMYTPINTVQGHEIDDLRIGLSASPTGTSNIAIAITEISNFIVSNIVVNS